MRKLTFVLCMLALVVLGLTLQAKPAEAGGYVCAYYSDATFTTVVGARGTGCCNEPISWGVLTIYKKCHVLLCLDVVCPIYS